MQSLFNDNRFHERVKNGEFTAKVKADRHPSLTKANEPYCTKSQEVFYYDADGNEVARVHQYLRTDGTIGASGKPDPKRLFLDGKLYRLQKLKQAESR